MSNNLKLTELMIKEKVKALENQYNQIYQVKDYLSKIVNSKEKTIYDDRISIKKVQKLRVISKREKGTYGKTIGKMIGEIFRLIIGTIIVIVLVVLCFAIGIWQNAKSLEERENINIDPRISTYRNL